MRPEVSGTLTRCRYSFARTQRGDSQNLSPRPTPALPIGEKNGRRPGDAATRQVGEAQADDSTALSYRYQARLGYSADRADCSRRFSFEPGREGAPTCRHRSDAAARDEGHEESGSLECVHTGQALPQQAKLGRVKAGDLVYAGGNPPRSRFRVGLRGTCGNLWLER